MDYRMILFCLSIYPIHNIVIPYVMAASLKKYFPVKNAAILKYMKETGHSLQTTEDWLKFRILLIGLPQPAFPDLRRHLVDTYILDHLQSSHLLYWNEYHGVLQPLRTTSDGNCLLHASLTAIFGVEDEGAFLRAKLHEMLTGDLSEEFKRRWLSEQDNMQNHYAQLNMSSFMGFEQNRDIEWAEILQAVHPDAPPVAGGLPYQSLEGIHVFALAHVLRSPIVVIAAATVKSAVSGEDLAPCFFGGVYLPLLLPPETCTRAPLLLAYHDMHFVPLVPVSQTEADSWFVLTSPSFETLEIHCTTFEETQSLHVLLDQYLNIEQLDVKLEGPDDSMDAKFRLPAVKLVSKPIPPELNIANSYSDKLWERHGDECAHGDCRLLATRNTRPWCEQHVKRRKMDDAPSESWQSEDQSVFSTRDEGNVGPALGSVTSPVGMERRPPSGKGKLNPSSGKQPRRIPQTKDDIPESPESRSEEHNESQPVTHKPSPKSSSFPRKVEKKPLQFLSDNGERGPLPQPLVSHSHQLQPSPTRPTMQFLEPVAIPPKAKGTRVAALKKADEPAISKPCRHAGCQNPAGESTFCGTHEPETSARTGVGAAHALGPCISMGCKNDRSSHFTCDQHRGMMEGTLLQIPRLTMPLRHCIYADCTNAGFPEYNGLCNRHRPARQILVSSSSSSQRAESMPAVRARLVDQCRHPDCRRASVINGYCVNHIPDSDDDDDVPAHEPGPSPGPVAPASGSYVSGPSSGTPSYEQLMHFQHESHRDRPRCRGDGCRNFARRGGYCNSCSRR